MKMRKFAGIIAAAVMTVAVGVTAFAAPSPASTVVKTAVDASGKAVEVKVEKASETPKAEQVTAIEGCEKMEVLQSFDLTADFEGSLTVTFSVAGVTANSKVTVLHYNGSAWEKVPSKAGEGIVEATFTSLSPVAIVAEKATLTSAAASSTASSPKTGEASTVLMLGVVAVLAAGAVYGVSRKSRA